MRIDALRVPPAWRDVHIARSPRSAIQAWGFDARGRKQYRYHARAVERRELRKHHRVRQLAKELPHLRRAMEHDARPSASASALDVDTVAATVLRLISETFCRVGGERYLRENGTFGITTLRKSHVRVSAGAARLVYRGKGKIWQRQVVTDRALVRLIARQLRTPGSRVFAYKREPTGGRFARATSTRTCSAGRGEGTTAPRTSARGARRCARRRCSPSLGPRGRRPRRVGTSRLRCGSCRRSSATRRRSAARRTSTRW